VPRTSSAASLQLHVCSSSWTFSTEFTSSLTRWTFMTVLEQCCQIYFCSLFILFFLYRHGDLQHGKSQNEPLLQQHSLHDVQFWQINTVNAVRAQPRKPSTPYLRRKWHCIYTSLTSTASQFTAALRDQQHAPQARRIRLGYVILAASRRTPTSSLSACRVRRLDLVHEQYGEMLKRRVERDPDDDASALQPLATDL